MTVDGASLRDQQRQLARDRIVEAAADEVVEKGLDSLSMPAVAQRAGVSLRTVYNHVESREALVDAISTTAEERLEALGAIDVVDDLAEMPAAIRVNWPVFDALGRLGDAWWVVRTSHALARGRGSPEPSNERIDARLREQLTHAMPGLDGAQVTAVLAVLRGLVSSEAFHRTRLRGVAAEDAAEVTAWAVDRLVAAIAAGDTPFPADADPG